jgi:hypothetical protein
MSFGVRSMMLASYDWPKRMYSLGVPKDEPSDIEPFARRCNGSAAFYLRELGCLIYYADEQNCMGHRKRKVMNIDVMIESWMKLVVGLSTAHTKDEADRYEAAVEECLNPILAAPISQIRTFASALAVRLESDPKVPYLVHRAFTAYVEMMKNAPDEEVKELKTALAKEIVDMVEDDAKRDLPAAMVRALQWRDPEQLEKVKSVVESEKAKGKPVRLRGRESCLFLEAGGSEESPEVCIQV